MPRRKKERDGNGYVPLDESSVKHALEIPVKEEPQVEKIERQGRIMPRSASSANANRGRKLYISGIKNGAEKSEKSGRAEREPPVKRVGKGEYILVITEKPQAASKIAESLAGTGSARKISLPGGVYYYEVSRDGEKIVVACAVGHLYGLEQKARVNGGNNGGKRWPVFDLEWTPTYSRKGAEFTKKYYLALRKLASKAKSFIAATDFDVEGEVIAWNIIRFICGEKDAKRMKFSSLTKEEINNSYNNVLPNLDWGQAIAGETRHYLDWMYGINLSRALMDAIKKAGNFRIMSIGRVQGPALNLIVKKELAIRSFKPEPFWQVFIIIEWNNEKIELKYIKDITKKSELKKFDILRGRRGKAETTSQEQTIIPPHPFDLTTLQTEAYRFHNVTPSQTLQIAQRLYLAGLISYPRTSSQKIPPGIDINKIIRNLSKKFGRETSFITRKHPVEGSKSDPAHPAIHPTGDTNGLSRLSREELKIYELVVKRFISSLCDNALVLNRKIEVIVNDLVFQTKGLCIKKKGWMEVYPAKLSERELPEVNGDVEILEVRIEEKMTQPPKRYSPASLVSELARRNLGTKSTRASIIETLYGRGYIKERSIEATPIGISLINTLEKHSPIIIDEKLTRDFEKEMDMIHSAKKDIIKKEEKVIEKAREVILKIEKEFRKSEVKIGKELLEALNDLRKQEKIENTLSKCPVCNQGNLHILFSRKFSKSFVACNKYPDCKTTFSLPFGFVKKAEGKLCDKCSWQKLLLIKKGRRPWEFCFNPKCPSRLEKQNSRDNEEAEV